MSQVIEQEIRTLRTHFWSTRDPEGRAFAPLADAYRRKGDLNEAMALVEDGLARLPGYSPGHLIAARILRARGDLEGARDALDHLLELDPENVLALLERAELARDTGDREGAISGLQRLLALDPDHLGARAALDRLEAATPAGGTPSGEDTSGTSPVLTPDTAGDGPSDGEPGSFDVGAFHGQGREPEPETEGREPEEEPDDAAHVLDFDDASLDDLDRGTWGLAADDVDPPEIAPGTWVLDETEPSRDEADPPSDGLERSGGEEARTELEEPHAAEEEGPPLSADASDDLAVFDFGMTVGAADEPEPSVDRPPLEPEAVDPVVDLEGFDGSRGSDEPPDVGAPPASPVAPEIEPAPGPDQAGASADVEADEIPSHMVTRTMAELYVAQGLTGDGLRIYHRLARQHPEDPVIQDRIRELREEMARPQDGSEVVADESVELDEVAPQWTGADEAEGEGPATPFAWTAGEEDEEGAGAVSTGRTIRAHFDDLLAWVPGAVPIADLSPEADPQRAPAGSPLARRLAARDAAASSGSEVPSPTGPPSDPPGSPPTGERGPDTGSAGEEPADDDLDDFRLWLESLDS